MPSGVNTIDFYDDFTVTAISDNEVRVQLKATLFEVKADKGTPGGYAPLDGSGKVPTTYIYTDTDADTVDGIHAWQLTNYADAVVAAGVSAHAAETAVHGATTPDRVALLSDISTSPGGPWEIYISLGSEALTL